MTNDSRKGASSAATVPGVFGGDGMLAAASSRSFALPSLAGAIFSCRRLTAAVVGGLEACTSVGVRVRSGSSSRELSVRIGENWLAECGA